MKVYKFLHNFTGTGNGYAVVYVHEISATNFIASIFNLLYFLNGTTFHTLII